MCPNARDGIRTQELLRDQALNLTPLTWLGYPRAFNWFGFGGNKDDSSPGERETGTRDNTRRRAVRQAPTFALHTLTERTDLFEPAFHTYREKPDTCIILRIGYANEFMENSSGLYSFAIISILVLAGDLTKSGSGTTRQPLSFPPEMAGSLRSLPGKHGQRENQERMDRLTHPTGTSQVHAAGVRFAESFLRGSLAVHRRTLWRGDTCTGQSSCGHGTGCPLPGFLRENTRA